MPVRPPEREVGPQAIIGLPAIPDPDLFSTARVPMSLPPPEPPQPSLSSRAALAKEVLSISNERLTGTSRSDHEPDHEAPITEDVVFAAKRRRRFFGR